jgi:hypothetical protein
MFIRNHCHIYNYKNKNESKTQPYENEQYFYI